MKILHISSYIVISTTFHLQIYRGQQTGFPLKANFLLHKNKQWRDFNILTKNIVKLSIIYCLNAYKSLIN